MRLHELCSVLRVNRRTIDDSSSRRIICVYVYKDGTRTNNPAILKRDAKSQKKLWWFA